MYLLFRHDLTKDKNQAEDDSSENGSCIGKVIPLAVQNWFNSICSLQWIPFSIRKNFTWVTLFLTIGWGLSSDTILSMYDVVSDYILAHEHFTG